MEDRRSLAAIDPVDTKSLQKLIVALKRNPFTPQVRQDKNKSQAKQRRQRYREKKPSRHVPTSCARTGAYNAAPNEPREGNQQHVHH